MSDSIGSRNSSTQSARSAALERRRALSSRGAAGLKGLAATTANSKAPLRSRQRPTTQIVMKGIPQDVGVLSDQVKAVLEDHRDAMDPVSSTEINNSRLDSSEGSGSQCGCDSKDRLADAEKESVSSLSEATVQTTTVSMSNTAQSVRQLSRQRRSSLAQSGKSAYRVSNQRSKGAMPNRMPLAAAISGLTGREAAKKRRELLCQQGRGDAAACKPTGRVRVRVLGPQKVEIGTTLSGTLVTGTQVERNVLVTGTEAGSCRNITGTEYIGMEHFDTLCAVTPEPAPSKVSMGRTGRGQTITGTEVGPSIKVTGDEYGECKTITGTEYLSADKFESFCSTKPFQPPAKVNLMATQKGLSVSGTAVGRSSKVTGDEQGADRPLTGTQYYRPQSLEGARRNGSGVPHKVSVMSTVRERTVTGTDAIPHEKVTGAERGACAPVTGTETTGLEQYQACNRRPLLGAEKVSLARTWHDQPVSGTALELTDKVTGDEYGACASVTGTEYVGPQQYAEFCEPDTLVQTQQMMSRPSGINQFVTTGIDLGPDDKITGSEHGENIALSGTPYSRQRFSYQGDPVAPYGGFSITTPARIARERTARITGTAYGSAGRKITGPVNLADGLVSGTPEFRYQDDSYDVTQFEPMSAEETMRPRLTGEGKDAGFAITGTGWGRGAGITGTEGPSTRRNPTFRAASSAGFSTRAPERRETSTVQITGSSGGEVKGPTVTYSGGTRG